MRMRSARAATAASMTSSNENAIFRSMAAPPRRLAQRRERRGDHQAVFLLEHEFARLRRPAGNLERLGAEPLALARVLVRPHVNVLIERPGDRVPRAGERRDLDALG